MITGKKILITGMAGSIGSELARQLAPKNKIFGIDINETDVFDLCEAAQLRGEWMYSRVGDIRDPSAVEDVFSDFKPDIVIHAAALKHVKPNEDYPIEAIKTNVMGTYNVLSAARKRNVKKFIFISTDKVLSGSIMGATKKLGEIMTRNAGYTAVRFGNVMGSRGSVLPFWEEQVRRGDPITVTDERMERYMMSIPEACSLVIGAIEIGEGGETIVLDMGKPIKIIALAKKLVDELKAMGKNGEIKIIGARPGESLTERLMSAEEEKVAIKKDKYFIIKNG